jgi:uncharacterized protein YjiS (DUF1127 family)
MTTLRVAASHATLAGRQVGHRPAARALSTEIAEVVLTWFERVRQRRQLRQLSDHMLKDIGLSRGDVETEVAKPFWRP